MMLSYTTTKRIAAKIHYSSSYIKTIQELLNVCGYKLTVDGICGYHTINAVYSFQAEYGLVKDGIPGPKTLAKLKAVFAAKQTAAASLYVADSEWGTKYPHFQKSEFKCPKYCNGYPSGVHKSLVAFLEEMRAYFTKLKGRDTPVHITSGLRCQVYNDSLKGSVPNSTHRVGKATDYWMSYVTASEILAYCERAKAAGKIAYYYTNSTNMNGAVHANV
jgi:hypothetical protein